jgi:ribonuclease HII
MKQDRGGSQVFADPEAYWRGQGLGLLCGVDEVGRGPLAGPVVAAAVIMPAGPVLLGLKDSKLVTPENRQTLDGEIRQIALTLAVAEVGAREIERLGILAASLRAMVLAVKALNVLPEMVLVDGNQPLPLDYPQQPVVKGDYRCPAIAAASILAKVYRDRLMVDYHRVYPQYNFASHKGYATAEHLEALECWGPCQIHRRTFKGVREWLTVKDV